MKIKRLISAKKSIRVWKPSRGHALGLHVNRYLQINWKAGYETDPIQTQK